jgi:hypothetical protein
MRRALLLLALPLILTPRAAEAGNWTPLGMGGRTGTMGGAGVAAGDDGAMPFLNPAGLSRVHKDVLSLAVSAYAYRSVTQTDAYVDPEDPTLSEVGIRGKNGARGSSIEAVPASLVYMHHLGAGAWRHTLALSVLVPYSERRGLSGDVGFGVANFNVQLVNSYFAREQHYFLGPSYGLSVALGQANLRLGASVFLAHARFESASSAQVLLGDDLLTEFGVQTVTAFQEGHSTDLVAVLGAQLDLGPLALGISAHLPSLHLSGGYHADLNNQAFGNGYVDSPPGAYPDELARDQEDGEATIRQPPRLAVGAAFTAGAFTVAADLTLLLGTGAYDAVRYTASSVVAVEGGPAQISETEETTPHRADKPTFNFAVGAEYRASPTWAVRAGAFSDLNNARREDEDLDIETLSRFGGVVGLGYGTASAETQVGLLYQHGTSTDPVSGTFGTAIHDQRTTEHLLSVLVSGSVDLGQLLAP